MTCIDASMASPSTSLFPTGEDQGCIEGTENFMIQLTITIQAIPATAAHSKGGVRLDVEPSFENVTPLEERNANIIATRLTEIFREMTQGEGDTFYMKDK